MTPSRTVRLFGLFVPPVVSGLGAVEAIRERTPLFDTFGIQNPDMIGQASFFTAEPADGGWRVTFETGWGDCPSGCIDRHTWTWDVAEDGTVTFVGEDGSPLAPEQLTTLQASGQNHTGIAGRATGGGESASGCAIAPDANAVCSSLSRAKPSRNRRASAGAANETAPRQAR